MSTEPLVFPVTLMTAGCSWPRVAVTEMEGVAALMPLGSVLVSRVRVYWPEAFTLKM